MRNSPIYFKTARVMRLTPAQTLLTLLLPGRGAGDLHRLRVGFSLTLIGTLLGEMFASQRGLGYLLMNAIGLHNIRHHHGADPAARGHRRDRERTVALDRPPPAPARREGADNPGR